MNEDEIIVYADLQKFQLTYNIVQDRICLEVFADKLGICIWLTRRMVVKLLPGLADLVNQLQPSSDALADTLDLQYEELQEGNHVEKRLQHVDSFVPQVEFYGDLTEMVVCSLQLNLKDNSVKLEFYDEDQQGVAIIFSVVLFLKFYTLLEQSVPKKDWGI